MPIPEELVADGGEFKVTKVENVGVGLEVARPVPKFSWTQNANSTKSSQENPAPARGFWACQTKLS